MIRTIKEEWHFTIESKIVFDKMFHITKTMNIPAPFFNRMCKNILYSSIHSIVLKKEEKKEKRKKKRRIIMHMHRTLL